jgi:hypothetical protein
MKLFVTVCALAISAAGQVGVLQPIIGNSYSASATVTVASSATDIAILPGNATNTVYLYKIRVSCTQTTAGIFPLYIIKRSSADTSGTSSSMTVIPQDSNEPSGISAPLTYTANPTTGSSAGTLDVYYMGAMASATASPNDIYISPDDWVLAKPIVLHGTAQQVAVNLNGSTYSGMVCAVMFEWIEK